MQLEMLMAAFQQTLLKLLLDSTLLDHLLPVKMELILLYQFI
jgi:hypothetical protein